MKALTEVARFFDAGIGSLWGFRLIGLFVALNILVFMPFNSEAESLLVVGNSLAAHPPAPDKGWHGNWGMAASSSDNDFVHQLASRLEKHNGRKIEISLVSGYPIEKGMSGETWPIYPSISGENFDYVVLEIGDNIDFTHPDREKFISRYGDLVIFLKSKLKDGGNLVCVGKWWANDSIDEQIRSVCESNNGRFVSLKSIASRSGSKASDSRQFSNAGVGAHPSDQAMREIAESIYCAIASCAMPEAVGPDIGVFYFPGWRSDSRYWKDLRGMPDSRSPNVPWPDREPLLGYYAEEDIKVAEQHIEWASQYGVTFFAYDWYWDGKATYLNHSIENFLKAPNNAKLKFSLLWANHSDVPRSLKEFDDMVNYWLMHYLMQPQFYKIDGKPVIFVFSNGQLESDANKFGWSSDALLKRANDFAKSSGLPGMFFVATVNARPADTVERGLSAQGYSAYTGWNYVASKDSTRVADYQSMVGTYLEFYEAAKGTKGTLPYIVPASPGWDSRPWGGGNALARTNPTPEKFGRMLQGAKQLLDSKNSGGLNILMIEAWNEFGEGAYIEPTKKWGFEYLRVINSTFSKTESKH